MTTDRAIPDDSKLPPDSKWHAIFNILGILGFVAMGGLAWYSFYKTQDVMTRQAAVAAPAPATCPAPHFTPSYSLPSPTPTQDWIPWASGDEIGAGTLVLGLFHSNQELEAARQTYGIAQQKCLERHPNMASLCRKVPAQSLHKAVLAGPMHAYHITGHVLFAKGLTVPQTISLCHYLSTTWGVPSPWYCGTPEAAEVGDEL